MTKILKRFIKWLLPNYKNKCVIRGCKYKVYAFDSGGPLCEGHFNQIKLFDLW